MKPIATKTYVLIWVALIVTFLLNLGQAAIDLGPINIVLGLAIALFQMLLIMVYFMHLRQSPALVWVFAASGFYWVGVMFVLGLNDYFSRGWGF